jgi:hypothetical protein
MIPRPVRKFALVQLTRECLTPTFKFGSDPTFFLHANKMLPTVPVESNSQRSAEMDTSDIPLSHEVTVRVVLTSLPSQAVSSFRPPGPPQLTLRLFSRHGNMSRPALAKG